MWEAEMVRQQRMINDRNTQARNAGCALSDARLALGADESTPRVGPPARACVRHRHEHRLAAVSLDRRIPLGELIVIDLHNIRTISRSNRCTPLAPTRAHRTLRQSPFSTCSVPAPMRSVTRTSMCILDPGATEGTARGQFDSLLRRDGGAPDRAIQTVVQLDTGSGRQGGLRDAHRSTAVFGVCQRLSSSSRHE